MAVRDLLNKTGDAIKDLAKGFLKKYTPYITIGIAAVCVVVIIVAACVGAFAAGGGDASSNVGLYSASTSSWEQFKRYVLLNEGGTRVDENGNADSNGAYYIVEDDWAGNPTVGHGLCLKSYADNPEGAYLHEEEFANQGINTKELVEKYDEAVAKGYDSKNKEHYKYFPRVSVEKCDAIWESHLKAKYESIATQYPDLTTYQHYALTDVVYRRGNIKNFKSEYDSKWTSSDDKFGAYVEADEPFSTDTLFNFFWDGGHSLDGVKTRKKNQWVLFKYGYYRPLKEYFVASGNFKEVDVYNGDGSVNEEKISELQLAFENAFNLVSGNLAGNNIGGRYNKETCTKVTGTYLGYSGKTASTDYDDASISYLGNNGLGIYQCTWWANGRASEYLSQHGTTHKEYPSNSGNGGEIYSVNKWFKSGSTPKPNSLVSYTSSNSSYGHVAYVEAVDSVNGYYYISHAGGGRSWYGIQKVKIGSPPWSGWSTVGFVYLDEPI